jgi:hypothetical protein
VRPEAVAPAGPPFYHEFKGHTAIRVGTGQDQSGYRLFRREAMRGGEAPLKQLPEYVPPAKLVQWMVL